MRGIILEPTATCNHFRWAEWLLRTLVDLPLTPVFRAIQVLADCEHASGYVQGFPRQGHFPDITFFAYHGSCFVIKQRFHMVQYPRHPRIPSHELKPRTTSPWSLLLLSHWLPIATCDDGPKQCVRGCGTVPDRCLLVTRQGMTLGWLRCKGWIWLNANMDPGQLGARG